MATKLRYDPQRSAEETARRPPMLNGQAAEVPAGTEEEVSSPLGSFRPVDDGERAKVRDWAAVFF